MYRILLAVDGSDHTDKVVQEALSLAEALKAEMTILNVVREYVFSSRVGAHVSDENWNLIQKHLKEEAEEIVQKAAKPFVDKGLPVKTEVVLATSLRLMLSVMWPTREIIIW